MLVVIGNLTFLDLELVLDAVSGQEDNARRLLS